ncbi:MAG: hypothetical protein IIC82_08175 [Chloroflexi bacterium]|nr:hypothetical protein [Chloroflexota bacterium]
MPLDGRTLIQLAHELASDLGEVEVAGTATAGGATTLTDATGLAPYADSHNSIVRNWIILHTGTSAGDHRSISALASQALTVIAWTNTPDTTSEYSIVRRDPQQYLDALRATAQDLRSYLSNGRRYHHLKEAVGREHVLGDAFFNGSLDLFTTANVPDGVTLDSDSTFTMETVFVADGRRALKVVTDGSSAGFMRQTLSGIGRFAGTSRTLFARVYCLTASRLTVELTDGVTTKTKTHGGGGWEWFALDSLTFGDAMTKIQRSIEISAGSAVTAFLSY